MEKLKISKFKSDEDRTWLLQWYQQMQLGNRYTYEQKEIQTSLGRSLVLYTPFIQGKKNLVIFPGARTNVLFWDLENQLEKIRNHYNVYLVDLNGQPNLSEGNSPSLKGDGFGHWVKSVLDGLSLQTTSIAGASLGGLVAMKGALVCPERIEALYLFNPAGIQDFSLKWKNLFYNIYPLIFPSEKNILDFLNNVVFCKGTHDHQESTMQRIVDYEKFAITRWKDQSEKPAKAMPVEELKAIKTPIHLFLGDHDTLFPAAQSAENAKKFFQNLKEVVIYKNVGHGIETYLPAIHRLLV